jgi:CPA2 family monovalent cation:H+ antiporter-2
MTGAHEFLENLAIVLCIAGITTVIFQRLRQPVVFGYLVAGMLVGPHIPFPLVADFSTIHALAELGVILLMFSLGLEFNLRKLFDVVPTAGVATLVETSIMIWLGYMAGRMFGWSPLESFYGGAIIAISSTTIIFKAFPEQGIKGKFTEIVFGILIVEDLIAILLLAILTTVSVGSAVTARELAWLGGRLLAFLASLMVFGMLIVPRLTRVVLRIDRPETTLVASVGICFAAALIAHGFGYSVALGAFIGGALVAESGAGKDVERLVEPLRNVFGAMFFVSVGMLIDPLLVARHWIAVVLFSFLVVAGKIVGVTVGGFLAGYGIRTSVRAGMSLSQIGEFSFIIAGVGLASGASRDFLYPVAVTVSAITTLSTPWMIRWSDAVAFRIDRGIPKPMRTFAALYASWLGELRTKSGTGTSSVRMRRLVRILLTDLVVMLGILLGASAWGNEIVEWVVSSTGLYPSSVHYAFLAIVVAISGILCFGIVRSARYIALALAAIAIPEKEPGKPDLAAIPRRALEVTLQIGIVLLVGMPALAILQPLLPRLPVSAVIAVGLLLPGIWFWRGSANLEGHVRAVSENIADVLGNQAGSRDAGDDAQALLRIREAVPGLGNVVPLRLGLGSHCAGKTLAEMHVGSLTGAAILMILRDDGEELIPTGKDILRVGDLLALAGTPEAIEAARRLLVSGPENSR